MLTPSSPTESISATSGLSNQSTETPTATTNAGSKDETTDEHDDRISERIYDEPKSWGTTLLAWWQEVLLCFASVALVTTLASVLLQSDNQGLPQWPLGLTLNTVVALLSSLARSAFLIPVAESISQLKWLWYRKERSLNDFQDFDKASRGAWGAIQLLKTTKGWSPGIISMVPLVTSILTSILTQSTVTYPTRLTLLSAKPALSRAIKVPDRTPYAGDMWLHMNPLFDNGVYSGLHHSYDQEFPFEQPQCPTTECGWNDFSSLGLCVKTTNITDSFNVTYREGRASGKGLLANLTQAHLKITQMPFDKQRKRSVYLVNKNNLTYFLGNQTANKIGAMEILFYYCVHRFKVSVENNIASRTIVSTSADQEDNGFMYMDGTRFKFDALKIPEESGTFFLLCPIMTLVLNVSLTAAFNNTYCETWERE
ncbi:hypothetical protein CGLO_05859 [Colletotrichum gloeosporioides Cg-14]|uniref:Uncharacterized protein n=1 Tax=Colletotrichum gloeosporioides (strain Cg-14) TaxID=1237896 RepID=T0LRJ3_COLGC|nr:hypothetical protein CGLO_05859 [Colletotrichum gloeosporioides Cg-14]